jgi:hypothetical protein
MQTTGKIPNLYPLLAKASGLDAYSYEVEMLQAETIYYTNAKGLVKKFVTDKNLNVPAFEAAWKEAQILKQLQQIAQHHLATGDLTQQKNLKKALLQAYYLGYKANGNR